jgi:Bifunctional DNA primase/polymerase, N-terminal/Primase C terminal 1 (PriCT-1)
MTHAVFSNAQPIYAEHGIATFPVTKSKAPAVRGYLKMGLDTSRGLVIKFPDAPAIGFATKRRNGVTILDIDTPDERVLADALNRHGHTPLIAQTGSGKFHAYYRHNGERRHIRPWRGLGLDVDLLGTGGFAIAPPSEVAKGSYSFIEGTLDDIPRLPVLRNLDLTKAEPVKEGARNKELWRHCMKNAHYVDTFDELLDVARTANDNFLSPMEDAEVIKIAHSAWGYTERGDNRFGHFGAYVPLELVNRLATVNPDSLALLNVLKARNGPNSVFPIANAMSDTAIALGWRRLAKARKLIVDWGLVEQVSPQTRHRPAQYRWPRTKAGGS